MATRHDGRALPEESRDLLGQVAVVTGASSGIGRAIAELLASKGAVVCGIARNSTPVVPPAAGPPRGDLPADVIGYHADLVDARECRSVVAQILADHGGVDIVVHAAGTLELGGLAEATVEAFDRLYAVNVRAPFVVTQALLPKLLERHGQVVFINSSVGLRASAGGAQYGASKHALRAVADAFRDEVNDAGLRVLSMYLGRTATPMQERLHAREQRDYRPERLLQPADVAAMVIASLLLPRTAEVTDIAMRPHLGPA